MGSQTSAIPKLRLGVNVDHVATVRNARGGRHPDPVQAAEIAVMAGADGITAHLREDRRHIRDDDIDRLKAHIATEDSETVRDVLRLLHDDHYLTRSSDGTWQFRFALIQRWWRLERGLGA